MLAGVTDPDYRGEIGLLLHNGGKEEYVQKTGGPLGCLLVLLCPLIKADVKLQQLSPGRTTIDPDPTGMEIWVTPPGKEP